MNYRALAFDLGASSGRAMLGIFDGETIRLEEIHRFTNDPVLLQGTLYWDILRLFFEIKRGLVEAKHAGGFDSIGIDTWGVDFGLIDEKGRLIDNPVHYRDSRTKAAFDEVISLIGEKELYARTGIQFMNLNTIFQLYALKSRSPEILNRAKHALLTPDLLAYFLTNKLGSEYTIASTTQLINPLTREWDTPLFEALGLPEDLFPPVVMPGSLAGHLSDTVVEELGLSSAPVYRVTSHDTASAVAAVPADEDEDFVYLSSGTWSLMGVSIDEPILSEASMQAKCTNEGGFDGKIRYLKNIMGLWLIQESRRQWKREGLDFSFAELETLAREAPAHQSFIHPDDLRLSPPGDMPERIRAICRETGQPVPDSVGAVVRVIYESLALAYRETKENIERITGKTYPKLHIVGGGTQAKLLTSLTADALKIPVTAGPVEATAAGNIAVQLIAAGKIKDLAEARQIIRRSFETVTVEPSDGDAWDDAYARFCRLFPPVNEKGIG